MFDQIPDAKEPLGFDAGVRRRGPGRWLLLFILILFVDASRYNVQPLPMGYVSNPLTQATIHIIVKSYRTRS